MDPSIKRIGDVIIERVSDKKPKISNVPPPPLAPLQSESESGLSETQSSDEERQEFASKIYKSLPLDPTTPLASTSTSSSSSSSSSAILPPNAIISKRKYDLDNIIIGTNGNPGTVGTPTKKPKINFTVETVRYDNHLLADPKSLTLSKGRSDLDEPKPISDLFPAQTPSENEDSEYDTEDESDLDEELTKLDPGASPNKSAPFIDTLSNDFSTTESANQKTSDAKTDSSEYDYDITEKLKEMGEISVETVKKGDKPRKVESTESENEISVTPAKKDNGSDTEDKNNSERKIGVGNMRRNIREVMDETQLDEATLAAQRQEMERLRRVQEQQRIIREVQRQIALNRQNNKTQHRVISLLQGNSSLIKQTPGTSMAGSVTNRIGGTILTKVPNGETKPMPRFNNNKGQMPFELLRVQKGQNMQAKMQRNFVPMRRPTGNLTPSVSIAPVTKKVEPQHSSEDTDSETDSETEKKLRRISGAPKDVVTISSSSDDDCIVLSEEEPEDPEPDEDPCNSGMHTNDTYNVPDDQGRVFVNVGHPENESDIFIAPQIARIIKPHQIGGVRFLYDNVIESLDRFNTSTGFGCILAHSMGLGKTLQVVCFSDVFLRHTDAKTILCIMPINTLQNWLAEYNMWLPKDVSNSPLLSHGEVRPRDFNLYVLNDSHKTLAARAKVIQDWHKEGGVLLIGYELYRLLSLRRNPKSKSKRRKHAALLAEVESPEDDEKNKSLFEEIHEALVKPGADLVICDEGHRIKNSHASISQALKQIRTKRRIVLTGYPLQNNLLEYWCMVDFVRPNYLGTKTEFSNMFERPIQNGQCIDSTPQDIRLMRYRAHVLHSLLEGFVQRRSHAVLQTSLPQKEEYVLLVRMTEFQRKLYDTFMNEVVRTKTVPNPLKAFAVCCKIWNHPDVLFYFLKKHYSGDAVDIDLEEVAATTTTTTTTTTTATKKKPSRPRPPRGTKREKKTAAAKAKPAASVIPSTSVTSTTTATATTTTVAPNLEPNVPDSAPASAPNFNQTNYTNPAPNTPYPNTPNTPSTPYPNTSNTPNTPYPNPSNNSNTQYPNAPYQNYNQYPQNNEYYNNQNQNFQGNFNNGYYPNQEYPNFYEGNQQQNYQGDGQYWQPGNNSQPFYNNQNQNNPQEGFYGNMGQPDQQTQAQGYNNQDYYRPNQFNPTYPQNNIYQPQPYPQGNQWQQQQSEVKTEVKEETKPSVEPVKDEKLSKSDQLENETIEEVVAAAKEEAEEYDLKGVDSATSSVAKLNIKEDPGIPYDWATELMKGYVPGCIENSAKMEIFFYILQESMALGDRILLFSQSLFTLNLIEEFLQSSDVPGTPDKWAKNKHYYRLDGSTSALEREKLINEYNSNPNIHLFLVSTRAGSLGINLVGANRVIVFDASWNPCHDTQAVCRVYRYGQKKPCFVYRLVMDSCLEKKIYDRQINKQGMSDRVVDECNPDAHLSMKDVTNLCWDDEKETEVKDFSTNKDKYIDVVMQKMLDVFSSRLSKEPFQHESLLIDRKEKKLSQAEKRLAKRSYELEKQANINSRPMYSYYNAGAGQGLQIRAIRQDGMMQTKPVASVRPMQSEQMVRDIGRPGVGRSRWIPAEVWQRQGMTAQEMTLPLDVVIPTNSPDRGSIVLKAGQKVLVLKSPKGIYMQLECGKIVAIKTAFKVRGSGKDKYDEPSPKETYVKKPSPSPLTNVPLPLKNNSAITVIPKGIGSGGTMSQRMVKPFVQTPKLQMRSIRQPVPNLINRQMPMRMPQPPRFPNVQRKVQLAKAKPYNMDKIIGGTVPKFEPDPSSDEDLVEPQPESSGSKDESSEQDSVEMEQIPFYNTENEKSVDSSDGNQSTSENFPANMDQFGYQPPMDPYPNYLQTSPKPQPNAFPEQKSALKNYRHNFAGQKTATMMKPLPKGKNAPATTTSSALHQLEQTTSSIGDNKQPFQESLNNITNSYAVQGEGKSTEESHVIDLDADKSDADVIVVSSNKPDSNIPKPDAIQQPGEYSYNTYYNYNAPQPVVGGYQPQQPYYAPPIVAPLDDKQTQPAPATGTATPAPATGIAASAEIPPPAAAATPGTAPAGASTVPAVFAPYAMQPGVPPPPPTHGTYDVIAYPQQNQYPANYPGMPYPPNPPNYQPAPYQPPPQYEQGGYPPAPNMYSAFHQYPGDPYAHPQPYAVRNPYPPQYAYPPPQVPPPPVGTAGQQPPQQQVSLYPPPPAVPPGPAPGYEYQYNAGAGAFPPPPVPPPPAFTQTAPYSNMPSANNAAP